MNTKKSLGQHWLKDSGSLEAICDAADVKRGDQILEIGPGTGELTKVLLDKGAEVTAVEIDEELADNLLKRFSKLPFKLNMLSILKFDLSTMPGEYKIVANIPYYLTNHLLRKLSETQHKPVIAVLLVQKEVAERVSAQPGKMSAISAIVQLQFETSTGKVVEAKLFDPTPKVDSQILILKNRIEPLYDDVTQQDLYLVIKAGFSQRRKTLENSLSAGLHISKDEANNLLTKAAINPKTRPQELSIDNWHAIYKEYKNT